tara:strand:- start:407 stop:826 length:420 start_codon:yes stop_codon:yes gene_type:complete
MSIALIFLSVIGLMISAYFTAVAYRWVQPDVRWIPSFCRMDERTCASIVFTPQARVFAVPNSVLGQLFYVALIAGTFFNWITAPELIATIYVAASTATVILGIYLSYALLFINRVACPLCFTSHGINLMIFLILMFGLK